MSDTLLPCPFCGSREVFNATVPRGIVNPNVACMSCGTRGPVPGRAPGTIPGDREAAEAIRLWNARQPTRVDMPSREDVARVPIYMLGNDLFRDLRAFLCAANIDPGDCKITVDVPTDYERDELVRRLRDDAPTMPEYGRASSAQAGNFSGKWQGVKYEFRSLALFPSEGKG